MLCLWMIKLLMINIFQKGQLKDLQQNSISRKASRIDTLK